jgi:cyanophycinase
MSLLRCLSLACLALLRVDAVAQGVGAGASVAAPSPGAVVPIGGALRDDNAAVWQALVQLAQGAAQRAPTPSSDKPRFVVLATAAGDPDAAAARIMANLERHGAVAEHVRVSPRIAGFDVAAAVRDPALVARIDAAQGVFMAGGEQARLLDALLPEGRVTPLLAAVQRVVVRGGVVAGTSAGAAVMSDWVFREMPDVLAAMQAPLQVGEHIGRGFALLPADTAVDQHFLKRGRVGRLLPLLQQKGLAFGIGVEEDSAAIVRGQEVQALGARGVLVVDLREATRDAALGAFNLRGARLSYLAQGDRYHLATRALQPSPAKARGTRIDPNAPGHKGYFGGPMFYPDILGDFTIVNAMARLVDSARREAIGLAFDGREAQASDLGFEWRLWIGPDTVAHAGNPGDDYTVAQVRLDVRPVRMARPLYRAWP